MAKLTLKTWITTAFLGVLIIAAFFLKDIGSDDEAGTVLGITAVGFLVSLGLTLPAMIGFRFAAAYLHRNMETTLAKAAASVYAVFSLVLTTIVTLLILGAGIDDSMEGKYLLWCAPFCVGFLLSIWIFRWPEKDYGPELLPGEEEAAESEEGTEYTVPFPERVYYVVSVLCGLELLYSAYRWIDSLRVFTFGAYLPFAIVGIVQFLLTITGLILFIMKRREGWILLAVLFCKGLSGNAAGIVSNLFSFREYVPVIVQVILMAAIFLVLDIVKVALLQNRSLKEHYRIGRDTATIAIIAGLVLGLLELGLQRYFLHF